MDYYRLEKKDYEQIRNITNLTLTIDKLYKKLYDLEIIDKKDTDDYKRILEHLNILIEKENKLYKECNLNSEKCISWVGYLLKDKSLFALKNDLESIVTQDYNDRVIRRILSVLTKIMEKDHDFVKKMIPSDLINTAKELNIPNIDKMLSFSISNSVEIQKAYEKDLYSTYLLFLNDSIKKENNEKIRNNLINSKYNFSFIDKEIEEDMISNNFEVSDDLYLTSRLTADLFCMNLNLYNSLKDSFNSKISMKQIIELLKISDVEYNDFSKKTTSIVRKSLLKASFLMMSDNKVNE